MVFVAPDADNLGRHWAVVDTDYCPWHEQYADDDYGDAIRVRPYTTLAPPQARGGNNKKRKRGSGGAGADTASSDSDGSAEEHSDSETSSSSDEDGGGEGDSSDSAAADDVDVHDPVYKGLYHLL